MSEPKLSKPNRKALPASRTASKVHPPVREILVVEQALARGQWAYAQTTLRSLAKSHPFSGEVSRLSAITALMQQNPALALEHACSAVEFEPRNAEYLVLVGRVHKVLGHPAEAIDFYRRAIAQNDSFADAHASLGNVLRSQGDLDDAIASFRRALSLQPNMAAAHAGLGSALAEQEALAGRQGVSVSNDGESLRAHEIAVELAPQSAAARHNLGVALARAGKTEQAIEQLNLALGMEPSRADTCHALCDALRTLHWLHAVRTCLERWLEVNPFEPHLASQLMSTLLELNEIEAALDWGRRALAQRPDMPELLHNMGNALQQSLDMRGALEHFRRASRDALSYPDAQVAWLMCLNYVEEDPQVLLEAHRAYGVRCAMSVQVLPLPEVDPSAGATGRGRRLRIGYLSGDFRRHSVSYFIEGMLASHDKRRVEVVAYHSGRDTDEVTARLQACADEWVACDKLADDALARRIREDGIDVLVDLSGHTDQNRLAVLARRPAALQFTYLGYPTTTGLAAIDCRVSDAVIDPVGDEHFSVERILRMPRGMFCYRPDVSPAVGEPPMLRNGFVTFGSFNNLAKIGDRTAALWASVLQAVPGSKLLLKCRALADAHVQKRAMDFLFSHGVDPARVLLNPWRPDLGSHLDVYREVDIGLDTYPFNGATTTCEALWMGVPVVSWKGATHVSRMGASILASAGFGEWIADSPEVFVDIASRLASQPARLSEFRAGARNRLRASPLMDHAGHTRDFEDMVFAAWRALQPQAELAEMPV